MGAPELDELTDIKYITVVDDLNTQIVAMGHKDEKYYQYMIGYIPTQSIEALKYALDQIDIPAPAPARNEIEDAVIV